MKKYIALVLSVIKYMQKCYRNSAMSENIFEDHRKNGLNSKLKRTKAILSRRFGDHVRVIGGFVPYVGSNCWTIQQKSWHKCYTPKKKCKAIHLKQGPHTPMGYLKEKYVIHKTPERKISKITCIHHHLFLSCSSL